MIHKLLNLLLPAMFLGLQLFLLGLSALKAIALLPAIKAAGNLTSFTACTVFMALVFGTGFAYIDYHIIKGWLRDGKRRDNDK